jgi:glucosamine-6-phosphate deaminase
LPPFFVTIFLTTEPFKRIRVQESFDGPFVSGFSAGFSPCRSMIFTHLLTRQAHVPGSRAKESRLTEGSIPAKYFQVGTATVEVHPNSQAAGRAAAQAASTELIKLAKAHRSVGVIFATGASQFEILNELTRLADMPWEQIRGFHMDEYVNLAADHPASFRRYLRERLTGKVRMKEFFEIDGSAPDPKQTSQDYATKLRLADPQVCFLGIGENGHLAFNDPAEADFTDPLDAKVVLLDAQCRQQQMAEGWFTSVEQVPDHAITLTIPALLRVPKLIVSVPGIRKAKIVRRAFKEGISTECPATILRTHPDATIYLDLDSASELDDKLLTR